MVTVGEYAMSTPRSTYCNMWIENALLWSGSFSEAMAHSIVLRWAEEEGYDDERWKASREMLAEYLAFFNAPSIDDVQWTFDKINNQDDWDTLEDTTNYIRRQIDAGRKIHNLNSYCRRAFETNIENAYVETEAEE